MQYPQTRYLDSLDIGINSSALSMVARSIPPTRTQGILTIGRYQSNTEDVYYTNVAGNTITISLRGLSQTALTLTSIAGNQKVHNANESLEMTTHHNYDTNKPRIDENDTITGIWLFQNKLKSSGLLDSNGNETIDTPATASAVNQLSVQNATTGNNVIVTVEGGDTNINVELKGKGTGKFIAQDGSEMETNTPPVTQAGIVNKKYVDDNFIAAGFVPFTVVAGENIATHEAVYIKASDGKAYKTFATTPGENVDNFVGFASATVTTGNAFSIYSGPLVSGFSGLTTGSIYYLSNTPGAISTSPGTIVKPIAVAISSSIVRMQDFLVPNTVTGSIGPSSSQTIGSNFDTPITTTFLPKRVIYNVKLCAFDQTGATGICTLFSGIWNGTDYNWASYSSDTALNQVGGGSGTPTLTPGGGVNQSSITFSIISVSATGLTFRFANAITAGTGSTQTVRYLTYIILPY